MRSYFSASEMERFKLTSLFVVSFSQILMLSVRTNVYIEQFHPSCTRNTASLVVPSRYSAKVVAADICFESRVL